MRQRGVLWYVFIGSRGGATRLRLVENILKKPKNANELTKELRLDYSTIRHSLRVLQKNSIVFTADEEYGAKYEITPEFQAMINDYEKIKKKYKLGKHT